MVLERWLGEFELIPSPPSVSILLLPLRENLVLPCSSFLLMDMPT